MTRFQEPRINGLLINPDNWWGAGATPAALTVTPRIAAAPRTPLPATVVVTPLCRGEGEVSDEERLACKNLGGIEMTGC